MLLAALACVHDIHPEYEAAREVALAVATDRPSAWEPDLVLAIGGGALARAVDAAATTALAKKTRLTLALPMGGSASLTPSLVVKKATLSPSDACASCLHFDMDLKGTVDWSVAGLSGSFPAGFEAGGAVELRIEDGTQVVARPYRVNRVTLKSEAFGALMGNPSSILQDFVRLAVGEALPPIPIVDLAESGLPVRDMRVRTADDTLRIEVLSTVPGALPAVVGTPGRDMILLGLSESALAGLLRRAAFERGTLSYQTAVDPRAIDVDGDRFGLDLRLWRLAGAGWWRDYEVGGTLSMDGGKLQLKPDTVKETDQSPGADLVDPLATLFEAAILDAISASLDRSLPAAQRSNVAGVGMRAIAKSATGANDTLVVEAELRVVKGNE